VYVALPRTAVLLDPYPMWLDAIAGVLEHIGVDVVGKCTNPTAALGVVSRAKPDLLITEARIEGPDTDGLVCLRAARTDVPELRAIVLSSSEEPEDIQAALAAGAVAYVLKSAHADDLSSAVRQAFTHSVFLAPSARPAGQPQPVQLLQPRPAVTEPVEVARSDGAGLTGRETEILRLVAEGHSNAQLAKILWVTEQTVKFHLSNIYRKLDVSNRTEAGRWAQIHGLLAPSEHRIVS
jgi:DNA-binding NarL/FixJ family response regulator